MLERAQTGGYAVGAFNCRYPQMVSAVFEAAEEERSPVILAISQLEIDWFGYEPGEFMERVRRAARDASVRVPYAVHLDHSWDGEVIERAIASGFSSVMFDASSQPLERNILRTREIVEMAHVDGVGVEAELGGSPTSAAAAPHGDEGLYTDPLAARQFVRETKCDFLAVSVGSSHGTYALKHPAVDVARIVEIRKMAPVPLVMHGGSSLSAAMARSAVAVPGGGISKLNLATELETTLLEVLGVDERMTPEQVRAISPADEERALPALKAVVAVKMREWLGSSGRA